MKCFTCIVFLLLALSVRLIIRQWASKSLLNSFTYSAMDQWESVLEGIYLYRSGGDVYSNDIVHQSPFALYFWSNVVSYFGNWIILFFVLVELTMFFSILKLSDAAVHVICLSEQRKKHTTHHTSIEMLLSKEDFILPRILVVMCYCFNPYSILAFVAQSTSAVWNIVCIWTVITYLWDQLFLSACLCALGCYLRLYPGVLLVPIIARAYHVDSSQSTFDRRFFRVGYSLVAFVATLTGLLWGSYVFAGHDWSFVDSVYLHQLEFRDCSPQLGAYWYLFVEMFEHFHELFVWVFQLLLATVVVALGFRFHREPLFLGFVILLTFNILQPYHSVGEFGYLLAIIPLWSHLYQYTKFSIIGVLVLLSALVLTPLLHYLWLKPGTANANFYFAACMTYTVGQILVVSSLMNAFVKREYILRVGPKLELSSGQKLILISS